MNIQTIDGRKVWHQVWTEHIDTALRRAMKEVGV
jgi:hypothetical protein